MIRKFFSNLKVMSIVQVLLLAIIYFIAGELSFAFAIPHQSFTLIIFIAGGFALAAVILVGIRIIPGIFIGQLCLGLTHNIAPEVALGIAIISSLEAIMASVFNRLYFSQRLKQVKDIRNLWVFIFFILQPFTVSLGVFLLWNSGVIQSTQLEFFWLSWWFSSSMGQLLITPFLLSFSTDEEPLKRQVYTQLLTALLIIIISVFIFSQIQLSSLVFSLTTLLLVFFAVEFGISTATLATIIFAIVAFIYTYYGQGIFISHGEVLIYDFIVFLFTITLSSQFFSTLFTQQHPQIKTEGNVETNFKAMEQHFIDIINSSDSIIWEANAENFCITFVSSRAERLLGYSISEWYQTGFWQDHLHPDDKIWASKYCINHTAKMKPYDLEYRLIAKDGTIIWLRDIISVISKEGRPRWLRGTMIDITQQKNAEKALRISELQFRTTFEHAPIGVINLSLKGDFLAINQYFCTMMGYSHQELLSMNIKQITLSNLDEIIPNWMIETASNGVTETQYIRKDGNIIWGSDSVHLFHYANGLPHYLIGTIEDVSGRKRNEERIKLSQTYGGVVTWEADLNKNRQTWSKEATHIFKLPPLKNASWEDFLAIIHPDDRKKAMNNIRAHLLDNTPYDTEYRIIDCDNQIRWIRSTGRAERDSTGKAIFLSGIGQDITRHKLMEQSLRESKQLMQSVMDILPVGLWILDAQGNILQGNPTAKKIWAGERYVGMLEYDKYKAWCLETKKQLESSNWAATKAITQGEASLDEELEIECFDGVHKIINNSVVPLFDDQHQVKGAIVVNRDITSKKQAEEELKRSNADLEQFAYAISHDMRQPLRMITSYLMLLESTLQKQLTLETQQFINFAVEGSTRMDEMILALLDFSRIGRKMEGIKLIDSREALDEALTFLSPEIEHNAGMIKVSGQWIQLWARQDQITRLLQNLIGNALKYHHPDSPPKIIIRLVL
ncbi:MAG: PAS domain S-box protein [Methylococcales bacterium]|nr:PAS domain S-box protein [Methylococcales bacterium]